jgi:hypothetical protein
LCCSVSRFEKPLPPFSRGKLNIDCCWLFNGNFHGYLVEGKKNWQILQTHEKICLGQFFKLFILKYVKPLSGESRTTKWTQHLGTQNEALKEWGCSEDTFIETLEKLFEECNSYMG